MLVTWLSWKLFFQTRKKAVMGKHGMWKNSLFLHHLFSLLITSQHPTGAGSGEKGRHPRHAEERSSPLCAEKPKGHGSNKKCADKSWKAKVIHLFYFYSLIAFTDFLLINDSALVVKRLFILSRSQLLGEKDC